MNIPENDNKSTSLSEKASTMQSRSDLTSSDKNTCASYDAHQKKKRKKARKLFKATQTISEPINKDESTNNEMCQNDTLLNTTDNSNAENIQSKNASSESISNDNISTETSEDNVQEAYIHLRDNAFANVDRINSLIKDNADNFQNRVVPKIQKREQKMNTEYERTSLRIERNFEILSDTPSDNENSSDTPKARVRYRLNKKRNYFSEQNREAHKYTVLSHKSGSNKLSAFKQETSQLGEIISEKGVIHAAFALANKIEVPTPLDSSTSAHLMGGGIKDTLLTVETINTTVVNKATEGAIQIAKQELENAGSDNDGYKAVKTAAIITADIVSDIRTTQDYYREKKSKDLGRKNDRANAKFERQQDNLIFQKAQAEYELSQAQSRVDTYTDKSKIELSEKTTVTPNSEKKRVEPQTHDKQDYSINSPSKRVGKSKDGKIGFSVTDSTVAYISPKTAEFIEEKLNSIHEPRRFVIEEPLRELIIDDEDGEMFEYKNLSLSGKISHYLHEKNVNFIALNDGTLNTEITAFTVPNETVDEINRIIHEHNVIQNADKTVFNKSSAQTSRRDFSDTGSSEADTGKMRDKSRVELSEKTTVQTSEDKSRVDTKSVDTSENGKGMFAKHFDEMDKHTVDKLQRKKGAETPHKYVIKTKKRIDPETGKTIKYREIQRKELSANEVSKGFVIDTVSNINKFAHGEIDLGKKDPNVFQTLDDKITTRLATRGAAALKDKALRDGEDNDGVQAINGTAKFIEGSGKAYDTAKSAALYMHENAISLLQPVGNDIRNILITGEERINGFVSQATSERPSMLQPKKDIKKSKSSSNLEKLKKKQNKKNQRNVFIKFQNKETAKQVAYEATEKLKKVIGKNMGVGALAFMFILFAPLALLIMAGSSGMVGGGSTVTTSVAAAIISPTSDLDLSLSEQYWTELAENLIKEMRDYTNTHTGYDKYSLNNLVTSLNHDPYKLLAYLSVKCKDDGGTWTYENAKSEIESIFNEQFEIYEKPKTEYRKQVTTYTTTWYSDNYYLIGTSQFTIPNNAFNLSSYYAGAVIPSNAYSSYDDDGNINGYAASTDNINVCSWQTTTTVSNVGKSNGEEYESPQTLEYYNTTSLNIEYFSGSDGSRWEKWWKNYEYQDVQQYEYKTLEYGIREKKSFDTIINERVASFDDEQKEFYSYYTMFNLGHQGYISPFTPCNVTDYAGYNTDVNGTDGLDNNISISAVMGEDVIAPCSGTLTKTSDTSCYIYKEKQESTIYLDNVTVNVTGEITKEDVIGKASSDNIVITVVDKDGNYLNPYLFIDWS